MRESVVVVVVVVVVEVVVVAVAHQMAVTIADCRRWIDMIVKSRCPHFVKFLRSKHCLWITKSTTEEEEERKKRSHGSRVQIRCV